jgi:hypothetical protein
VPTAVHAVADTHETASSPLPSTFVVRWVDHVDPFQRSTSASISGLSAHPTAVQALAEAHDTPEKLPRPRTWGVGSISQLVPFQPSARVSNPEVNSVPTAVHDTVDTHDTLDSLANSSAKLLAGLGVGCTAQFVPFQTSANGALNAGPLEPTATHHVADTQDTPSSSLPRATGGVA